MNWMRILVAGVASGIVTNLAAWVMHGFILGDTYKKYPQVFTQTEGNPAWFFLVSIMISLCAATLFARTRKCWGAGWKGGLIFGFFAGMVGFFQDFFNPLVLNGFPYFLVWCWGGVHLILFLIGGAVTGMIIKEE
ncbi:MAG TPA: hypothetical protein PK413_19385 [Thermoanaerobaculia bacterium]|nr:hypothetical protein [Thermoanaerobaculia bacterium]